MKKTLLLALVLMLIGTVALADEVPAGPYTYDMGWLYVTGCADGETELNFPENFTNPNTGVEWEIHAISEEAFKDRTEIVSANIPEGYANVQVSAFEGCTGLTSVTLPQTMIAVDDRAFAGTALQNVTFGAGLSFVGNSAFADIPSLKAVTFTGALPAIEQNAFAGAAEDLVIYVPDDLLEQYTAELRHAMPGAALDIRPSGSSAVPYDHTTPEDLFEFEAETGTIVRYLGYLERVDIPAAIGGVPVETIGRYAFNYRYSDGYMYYLTIPEGVETIEDSAFAQASHLGWVNFPSTLKTVGPSSFKSIRAERVVLNDGLETIGDGAFAYTGLDLQEVVIPDSVTAIGESAFMNAKLADLKLPKHITQIAPRTCFGINVEGRVVIPDGVTTIGSEAFRYSHIAEVVIPESVQYIDSMAFANCTYLNKIIFLSDTMPALSDDAFADSWSLQGKWGHGAAVYIAPSDEAHVAAVQSWFDNGGFKVTACESAVPGMATPLADEFDIVMNGSTRLLGAYHGEESMITLPERNDDGKIAGIADAAFKDDQTLSQVVIPKTGTYKAIGKEAFAGSSVESVTIPETVKTIWDGAFRDCRNLRSITIPASVSTIGPGSFAGCTALEEVVIQSGCKLPDDLFDGCVNLRSVTLTGDTQIIAKNVFSGCKALEHIDLPASVSIISDGAFAGCTALTDVVLPAELSSLGNSAFAACTAIREIVIPAGVNAVGANAFENCTGLEKVTLAGQYLYDAAFRGCAGLRSVSFEKLQAANARNAFEGTNLEEVVLPGDVDVNALRCLPVEALEHVVLAADATDEQVAAISTALNRPWYQPVLRVGETAGLQMMAETPTDASDFEFDPETGRINGYYGADTDVVIPREIGGVTVRIIGRNTFDRCRDYTDTEIINNVTEWVRLRSVVIPETVEVIEDSAFEYCQQLQSFICYAPLETTGRATFLWARKLHTVQFVNGVRVVDNYVFQKCDSLEHLYFGNAVQKIGVDAFSLSNVKSLYLDAEELDSRVVNNCPELTELHLGCRIQQAEAGAIVSCPKLETVYVEGTTAAFIPRDGLMADVASVVNVGVKAEMSDEDRAVIQRSLTMWSTAPSQIVVGENSCGVDHAVMGPAGELMPDEQPKPVVTEAPAAPVTGLSSFAAEDVLGIWYLNTLSEDGMTLAAADMGLQMTLELNADGTLNAETNGEASDGSWSVADGVLNVVIDGDSEPFVFNGTELMANAGGMVMVFTREAPGESFTAPETVAAMSADEFNGEWTAVKVDAYGMMVPAAMVAEEMAGLIDMQTLDVNIHEGIVSLFGAEEEAYEFEEGALVKHGGMMDTIVRKNVDGTITVEFFGMSFFCEAAAGGTQSDPVATAAPVTGGDATADAVTGTWYLNTLSEGDMTFAAADMGFTMTLELNADGTLHAETNGETSEGSWNAADGVLNVVIDGDSEAFVYNGSELMADVGSMTMVFTREAPAPGFSPAPVNEAAEQDAFNGIWEAVMVEADGSYVPMEAVADELAVLLGAKNTQIEIVDANVVLFGCDEGTFRFENGALVQRDGAVEQIVRLHEDGMLSIELMGMTIYCEAGTPDLAAYEGTWYAIYLSAGPSQGNPQEMWSLLITLDLNPDGTGSMDYAGSDEGMVWYYDSARNQVYYGENLPDVPDTPLSFTEEGYLLYGTAMSGYIIFSHNQKDTATVLPTLPPIETPAPVVTPVPAAPVGSSGSGDLASKLEKKYVCTSASASGVSMDPSMLGGEYSVIFHENHTTELTIVGQQVPGLAWTETEDGQVEINYFGTIITFQVTDTGFVMDYFGAMLLTMEEAR